MKFIEVRNILVNAGLVAWAEKATDGSVMVHFAVPKASVSGGSTSAVATDHYFHEFRGEEANKIWQELKVLYSP